MQIGTDVEIEEVILQVKDASLLENLLNKYQKLGLQPILGYEMEFYLAAKDKVAQLKEKFGSNFVEERGYGQYEIIQGLFANTFEAIDSIHSIRAFLQMIGANLHPKPFADDYGSSLHFHFNLLDIKSRQNLFLDKQICCFAASGICSYLAQSLYLLMPTAQDYLRFDARFMAPTHICYGFNNRTAVVRIPDAAPKRLEYRVCSNNTDPYIAVFSLLKSALIGITNKCTKHMPIFGNAYDAQYNLPPIAANAELAKKAFKPAFFLSL